MNGLCSACQQPVEVVDFRLGEGIVIVRCTACGKQQRLSLSEASGAGDVPSPQGPVAATVSPRVTASAPRLQPAASAPRIEPLFAPPEGFCPKCVAPRAATATSCPACGLVFGNASGDELQPSKGLAAAFQALAGRWGEAPEHARFLHLAQASGELAAAGRLYRIRLAQAPADAVARASLEATVKMASAPVSVAAIKSAPTPEQLSRRVKWVMVAVTLVGPSLLFALIRFLGRH